MDSQIVEICSRFRGGSSGPFLALCADGAQVVFRDPFSGDSAIETVCDELVSVVAAHNGITVPRRRSVLISQNVCCANGLTDEDHDCINNCRGRTIRAAEFVSQIFSGAAPDDELKTKLFFLDVLFQISDRRTENTNLLCSGIGWVAIDFGCSLVMRRIFNGFRPVYSMQLFDTFCVHPWREMAIGNEQMFEQILHLARESMSELDRRCAEINQLEVYPECRGVVAQLKEYLAAPDCAYELLAALRQCSQTAEEYAMRQKAERLTRRNSFLKTLGK